MSTFYQPGDYVCEVVNQGLGETSNGNPQFFLTFKVLRYADNDERVDQSYERTHYRAITDKTIPYFCEDLKALGFQRSGFRFLSLDTAGHQSFVGNEVVMNCRHESYQGKEGERWNIAREGGALDIKPLPDAKLRQLDAMFGTHLKGMAKEEKPQPVAAGPARDDMEVSDEDVPF